ncbi:glycosyltransferase family A protein [Lysinibacillus capsici]|uniref:glycosyltransferase family A protein n=1 Tax=Lysinibacillus capsici TaxID=2115968 RepID=UPI0039FBDA00
MDTAFVTFIYPKSQQFFEVFLNSLNNQSNKNFKLLVFNDGCNEAEISIFLKSYEYEIEIINNTCNSVAATRLNAFKYLANQPFNNFIFGDIDDTFADNRVEIIRKTMRRQNIIFNELNLCDATYNIIQSKMVSSYLEAKVYVSLDMVQEQNLIGFSHLSVSKMIMEKLAKIELDCSVKVVDWVVISKLLKEHLAFFESQTCTNYIFHANNLALFDKTNLEELMFLIDIKIITYTQLIDVDKWYTSEIENLLELKKLIKSDKDMQAKLIELYSLKEKKYYPWWAQIKNSEELKNELRI